MLTINLSVDKTGISFHSLCCILKAEDVRNRMNKERSFFDCLKLTVPVAEAVKRLIQNFEHSVEFFQILG